jgi:hypothetical protein
MPRPPAGRTRNKGRVRVPCCERGILKHSATLGQRRMRDSSAALRARCGIHTTTVKERGDARWGNERRHGNADWGESCALPVRYMKPDEL